MKFRRTVIGLVAAGALALGACSNDSDTADTVATSAPSAGVTVERAWARTSPAGTTMGAAYMDITSTVNDTLVGVGVDQNIARVAEMHEMAPAEPELGDGMGDGMAGDMDSDMGGDMGGMGEMVMRQVESIDLPAGTKVSLAPGGYHVMLIDLVKPLTAGQTFDLTLEFGSGNTSKVVVTVSDIAP